MKTTIFTPIPKKEEYASFDKQPEIIEKIENLKSLEKIPDGYIKVIDLSNTLKDSGNEALLNFIIGSDDPEFSIMDDDIESSYIDPLNFELTNIFHGTYDSDYVYGTGVSYTNNELIIAIVASK